MTSPCTPYRQKVHLTAICQELVRRFQVDSSTIEQHGGLLNAAVHYADREYKNSLSSLSAGNWQAPRQNQKSFVRFLDRHQLAIPWYFQNRELVLQVQNIARAAEAHCKLHKGTDHCEGTTKSNSVVTALRNLWISRSGNSGWGITYSFTKHVDRSPDQTVHHKEAICTEWTNIQFASALIAGIDSAAQLTIGKKSHVEPFLILGANLYWNQPLRQTDPRATLPTTTSDIAFSDKADIVLASQLNKIASDTSHPKISYRKIERLLPMIDSLAVFTMAQTLLGDFALLANDPCKAKTHYAAVLDSRRQGLEVAEDVSRFYSQASSLCPI